VAPKQNDGLVAVLYVTLCKRRKVGKIPTTFEENSLQSYKTAKVLRLISLAPSLYFF